MSKRKQPEHVEEASGEDEQDQQSQAEEDNEQEADEEVAATAADYAVFFRVFDEHLTRLAEIENVPNVSVQNVIELECKRINKAYNRLHTIFNDNNPKAGRGEAQQPDNFMRSVLGEAFAAVAAEQAKHPKPQTEAPFTMGSANPVPELQNLSVSAPAVESTGL